MAEKIKSQKGSPNHKQQAKPRYRDSDYDTGYLWGAAGKAKARKAATKKGYLWKGETDSQGKVAR